MMGEILEIKRKDGVILQGQFKLLEEKDIKDINKLDKYLNLNPLVLAYLGDSIYEVYIRKYLIDKGNIKVNELQKAATKFVSAKSQASLLNKLMESDILKLLYHTLFFHQ